MIKIAIDIIKLIYETFFKMFYNIYINIKSIMPYFKELEKTIECFNMPIIAVTTITMTIAIMLKKIRNIMK